MYDLKKAHQPGLKGILYIYGWRRLKKSLPFKVSLVVSLVVTLSVSIFYPGNILRSIVFLSETNISVLPSLLGFTLGGYALIIGFASSGNLKNLTEPAKDEKGSVFQLLVAIFSINILQQFSAFMFSFFISLSLNFNYGQILQSDISLLLITALNCVAFLISFFLTLWALFTIPFVVTNLFNLAQINHSIGTVDRINEQSDDGNQ